MLGSPLSAAARMAQDSQQQQSGMSQNNSINNNSNNTCYVGLESLPGLFASNDGEGPYNEFYFSETSHALRVLQGTKTTK